MSASSVGLYSSPIQQVLVLQEQDDEPSVDSEPTLDETNDKSNTTSNGTPSTPTNRPLTTSHPTISPTRDFSTRSSSSQSSPISRYRDRMTSTWRTPYRVRTTRGLLVLCLHIGIDPQDVWKPNPCARQECWIEPNTENPTKSIKHIGNTLRKQYETLSNAVTYSVSTDPTEVDIKREYQRLRRHGGKDRVVFHYNGHGVPKPTEAGEIWVFSSHFKYYIPLNFLELQAALEHPTIYIFDCHSAGSLLARFKTHQKDREHSFREDQKKSKQLPTPPHRHSILLGACEEDQLLPMKPNLPADLFTTCLTTPIKAVLHWFVNRSIVGPLTPELIARIPDNLDLGTPMGDLRVIYRAITDCIAWNVFPEDLFKRIFRQDMFLANLVCNYLLAERIMRSNGCTPVSYPTFPETHNHPLWETFDLAVEEILYQLPPFSAEKDEMDALEHDRNRLETSSQPFLPIDLLRASKSTGSSSTQPGLPRVPNGNTSSDNPAISPLKRLTEKRNINIELRNAKRLGYRSPTFFEDQLTAFEVWLDMGPTNRGRPEQLPMMLHALMNKKLQYRGLCLLSRYLQTGVEAVFHALSVGIVPYLIKILEHAARNPRSLKDSELVFLWSKILAADESCRSELAKNGREKFFVRFLQANEGEEDPKPVYLAVAMFTLSVIAKGYADRILDAGVLDACAGRLHHENPFVRRWACLCLTQVVGKADSSGTIPIMMQDNVVETLKKRALTDSAPDVRAAAVSTISAVMNSVLETQSNREGNTLLQSFDSENLDGGSFFLSDHEPAQPTTPPNHEISSNITNERHQISNTSPLAMLNRQISRVTEEEQKAMLHFGNTLAEIGRRESSVLVRREVSCGIATSVEHRSEKFIQAAYLSDLPHFDNSSASASDPNIDECALVYCRLWTTLSELAFDPHPVVAATARNPYDYVIKVIFSGSTDDDPNEATDNAFSPPPGVKPNSFLETDSKPSTPENPSTGSIGTGKKPSSSTQSLPNPLIYDHSPRLPNANADRLQRRMSSMNKSLPGIHKRTSSTMSATFHNVSNPRFIGQATQRTLTDTDAASGVPSDIEFVRVGGGFGTIKLDSPYRYPLKRFQSIPRTNSASVIAGEIPLRRRAVSNTISQQNNHDNNHLDQRREGFELVGGLVDLLKTFGLPIGRPNEKLPRLADLSPSDPNSRSNKALAKSPPRPPRRNHSYQVLSTARSISPETESTMFTLSRQTSYYPLHGGIGNEESKSSYAKKMSRRISGLSDPGIGKAALSLYEWSSALIAKVEFDSATTEYTYEEEAFPRYTTLWNKYTKLSDEKPMADQLRAFALSGEGDDIMGAVTGAIVEEKDPEAHLFSKQLSRFPMAAGGGSIIAMTFLPRDIGMGDDQLLATGDSNGSVGIYDIHSGKCQGSFGIPSPPGIPRVGISALLCLNTPSPIWSSEDRMATNSRSALILAGAYDGRVAVFKSDLLSPKYRIMSTFQASGQSYWSKMGTSRDPCRRPARVNFSEDSPTDYSPSNQSSTSAFADAMRDSGNGLTFAFDSGLSFLAAGGCDGDIVRVWDLKREQCTWEASCVSENSWPTAISMLKYVDPNIFVVGSSEGHVNMIDIRSPLSEQKTTSIMTLGRHKDPIISAGICPERLETGSEYDVVSADAGGTVALWDPRVNEKYISKVDTSTERDFPHSRAHRSDLTTMAVHPTGRYIASGSSAKCVKIFGTNTKMIRMITKYKSAADTKTCLVSDLDSVTSLSFKHRERLLAVGGWNGIVMTYGDHVESGI